MRTENPIDSQPPPHPSVGFGPVQGGHVCPVIVGPTFRPPSDGANCSLSVFTSYKLNQASVILICL
jgi:hypothetical protein